MGSDGGAVNVSTSGRIDTYQTASGGIVAISAGGQGGAGGDGGNWRHGQKGGTGGTGGTVTVTGNADITTRGNDATGVYAVSVGGNGCPGGSGSGAMPGGGGFGGKGGEVSVVGSWNVTTSGDYANGIWARSVGGNAGAGGSGGWLFAKPGSGGDASDGDKVTLHSSGTIETSGKYAYGLYAQSGGGVDVRNEASGIVRTNNLYSHAIYAQSIGGGGSGGGRFGLLASVGGEGTAGGNGGTVTVVNDGAISTGTDGSEAIHHGDYSHGIYAQSIGGGGGDGGRSGGLVSIGGDGGGGGNADTVKVDNEGSIRTRGDESHALFAQSVGGGGGAGGDAVAVGAGASVSIGGKGGAGGDGADVTVTNTATGSIVTGGERAHAIFAQSIGGGGGNGGFAISGTAGSVVSLSVAVGGSAGTGGDAGAVEVLGGGNIDTYDTQSYGIFAQSVGGGGGSGGFAIAGSYSGGNGLNLALGGKGGGGGIGKTVDIGSATDPFFGSVHTRGERAHGIVAQSIGGSGGNGGFAISASLLGGASLNLAFGGDGAGASDGNTVNIGTASAALGGTLTTHGERAHGIVAQSIGGGGGTGGLSIAGGVTAFGGLSLSMGGNGDSADTVTVVNHGNIATAGEHSYGIMAQSIGGRGGAGGTSGSVMVNFSSLIPIPEPYPTGSANISLSLGGDGGDGGTGGLVAVTNEGTITTREAHAYGIYAQSVGGGSGDGGNVIVTNNETIDTSGVGAHGIYVQSIGGSGGTGGDARSMILSIDPSNWRPDQPEMPDPASISVGATLSVGGSAGAGGDAGAKVEVVNTGSIITRGADAFGILAQSIGGGGGVGGNGYHGLDWEDFGVSEDISELLDFILPIQEDSDLDITVGGAGGASGDGKEISIDHSGDIVTTGKGSVAVFVQSIGGGGGLGGIGAIGDADSKQLSFGGDGGSSGNGGLVKVVTRGNISTAEVVAHGIFAQSIGGGGYAGNIDLGVTGFGDAFALAGDGGNAGNGGEVIIEHAGNIVTRGTGAMGIFAQSAGGGGGLGGSVGFGIGLAGSVGGLGAGGDVSVTQTGDIRTFGSAAHGIFAQSNGGISGGSYAGSAGLVTVNTSGNIVVTGAGAHGIVAQSLGSAGNGNVIITIDGGSVIGGSADGVGVNVLGGASNSLTNRGTISALSGNALRGGSGSESLTNYGTLTGNVDLGGGSNTIHNYGGARFNSLDSIVVGAGRSFINAGVLSPGGAQAAQSTLLTGNLEQQTGGAYHVDFSLAGGDSDHLNVSGSALLAGSIRVTPIDTGSARSGNRQSTVLTAADGTTTDQLTLITPASPLVRYRLVYPSSNEIAIASWTDFAPAMLGNNARRMGTYLNAIQKAGGSSSLAPIIAALFELDTASLRVAYEKLDPGALDNQSSLTANASLGFNDALHSCRQRDGEYRFSREGECGWMRLGSSIRDQDRTDYNVGFRQDTLTLSGGLQRAIATDRYLGFGLAYEKSTLDSSYSDQDGERFEGGLILKRIDGPTRLSGSLTAGYGRYDSRRLVDIATPGLRAKGRQKLWSVSLQGRISHDLALGEQEYLRPMLGLSATYVARDSYRERGAGAANLYVASGNDTFVALQPAIEFGGERPFGDEGSLLRHFVRLGITHFLGSNEQRLKARLEGAPAGIEPFTVITRSDRTYGDLALGIDLLRKDGTTARLEYNGQFSSNSNTRAIALKLSMPF